MTEQRKKSPLKAIYAIFTLFILAIFCVFLYILIMMSKGRTHILGMSVVFLILMSVICLTAGGIILVILFRQILKPVLAISVASQKIAKGYFNVDVSEKSVLPEIRELSHNFNNMVHDLSSIETLRNDFISNVSHEFKTPLSAIEGYVTLLQNQNLSKEAYEKYVSNIFFNTHRLSKLSENILSLSRLENHQAQKEIPVLFALDEQLRQVLLTYENKWSEKNLNLDLDLEEIQYRGYKFMLSQIWSNLIENAIKYSNPNGLLSIRLFAEDKFIIVKIADTGCGIAPENQEKIFSKFYQEDSSHHSEGNGLGLAIVRELTDLCQAQIFVESAVGKGSVFTVALPKVYMDYDAKERLS